VCGYPGSVASIWQQWGRAGRAKEPSLAVYIAGRDSLDQYLFENPEKVLGRRVEAGAPHAGEPVHPRPHLLAPRHHEAALEDRDEEYFGYAYGAVVEDLSIGAVESGGEDTTRGTTGVGDLVALGDSVGVVADGRGGDRLVEARRAPMDLTRGDLPASRPAYEVEDSTSRSQRARPQGPNRYYTRVKVETDVRFEESENRDLQRANCTGVGADHGSGNAL
jgi:DEAD/DEAH box helicase domain-containing protein